MKALPITTKDMSSNLAHGEVYSMQHVIKFVSDLRQVGGFLWVWVSSTNKTAHHDITDILLKVALNTINQLEIKDQLPKISKKLKSHTHYNHYHVYL
jgi:hypothetical protein